MKITFPHMGNLYICVKALLDDLNVEYVIPPFNSKKSLELGTRFVPECLPLKITLGNFLEANELGADTALMAGGCGPCRFGYYCEMHREILADLGINMNVITLEPPNGDIKELFRRVREFTGGLNLFRIFNAVRNATKVAIAVDELERLTFKVRPCEIEKGSVNNIYKQFRKNINKTKGSKDIKELIVETKEELSQVSVDDTIRPLKIGIVGEIYTTIDDYTSFNIQQRLGGMGVEVHRYVTVSDWITEHIIKQSLKLPRDLSYAEAAKPYLGTMIGGHAQETIGNTILYSQKGFDGVIQIYPLTCMPEIVAESILPAVERDYDIPVLTLIIDEMTGETGYLTRVEAFIDLLYRRREKKRIEGKYILSGD